MNQSSRSGNDSPADPHGIAQVLADMQKQYIHGLPVKAENIEKLWSQRQIQDIETEFHKLKGTGKTYGLPEISQIGEVTEHLCESGEAALKQALPLALRLLRKVHQLRSQGQALELQSEVDFQELQRLRSTTGQRS
jgi:hypothetical protein